MNFLDKVKCLWKYSHPALKGKWPLTKELQYQPYNMLTLANGSWFKALVGDPDKIRSDHPTIVVFDEAAHMTRFQEAYDVAQASRCQKVFAISSAKPGDFRNMTEFARPVDWPEYEESFQ